MKTSHNNIEEAIRNIELITSKGQIGSSRNRMRIIRVALRRLRKAQAKSVALRDIGHYTWIYLNQPIKRSNRRAWGWQIGPRLNLINKNVII